MIGDTPPSVAIRLLDVTKTYGSGNAAVTAVKSTTLEILKNEFFTLLGPSGCGKTSLLRLIGGFEYPTSGTIHLDGDNIATVPPYRRPVNTVFQNYALFPHMTVRENIAFGLRMLGRPRAEILRRVHEMLRLVRLEHLADRRTSQISGGQQQRVALARALAPEPKVLLLDESLSALDYKLRKEMQVELKTLQAATGITFIFVTHDQEEALTMSDRVAVLSAGEVMQVGTPRDIYDKPANRFVAGFVGETNLLRGKGVDFNENGALIELDGVGKLLIPTETGFARDTPVDVIVRPEHVRIRPLDKADSLGLSAVVTAISFCGAETQYSVELKCGSASLIARQYNAAADGATIEIGDEVSVDFARNNARILQAEGAV